MDTLLTGRINHPRRLSTVLHGGSGIAGLNGPIRVFLLCVQYRFRLEGKSDSLVDFATLDNFFVYVERIKADPKMPSTMPMLPWLVYYLGPCHARETYRLVNRGRGPTKRMVVMRGRNANATCRTKVVAESASETLLCSFSASVGRRKRLPEVVPTVPFRFVASHAPSLVKQRSSQQANGGRVVVHSQHSRPPTK
jgi:hypothetical protein